MDRFLLAENPIKTPNSEDYNKQYIIHTVQPKCIIEVVFVDEDPNVVSSGYPHQVFEFTNSDNVPDKMALIVRDPLGNSNEQTGKLLPRAWRWYRTYIEWEDKNIDIQEEGKWN